MSNIKIGTFNVKGLRDSKKRRKIFHHLHQTQYDVICLQETHSTENDEKLWRSKFGGKIFYDHGSSNSRGVMIMIRKKAPLKIGKEYCQKSGILSMLEIQFEENSFMLINVYAPNTDNPGFYVDVFHEIKKFEEKTGINSKILVGDLNLVLDLNLDKVGGRDQTHDKCAATLKAFMEDEGLVDVWRSKNPEAKEMTWKILNPKPIFERLDYILISEQLMDFVGTEGISPGFLSDHAIPWLVLTPSKTRRGRGFWKLNNRLLADENYVELIKQTLKDILGNSMNDMKKWEWVKHKIREKSIQFSSQKNKSRSNELLIYEKKLKDYENQLVQANDKNNTKRNIFNSKEILEQIAKVELEREGLIEYKVRGSMLRARRQ